MKTYAVPDLHGRYDLLVAALRRIEDSQHGGTVVFLGDYVDRGPQSRQIIERLMVGPTTPGWRWVCLKGNHEDMLVGCISSPGDLPWWLNNGGSATLASFDGKVPPSVLEWCSKLPLWHDDGKRIYVHAAIEPSRAMEEQGEAVLLWMRYPERADIRHPTRHIVHGHTPHQDGPECYPGRTNLDCYAVGTGRLVVGIFDDEMEGGPVGFLEIMDSAFAA